jgi:hippurate hydrolase
MDAQAENPPETVLAGLQGLLSDLEGLYTDVHAHPELSMQETRTAALAADHLRKAGYDVTTGVGGTGSSDCCATVRDRR